MSIAPQTEDSVSMILDSIREEFGRLEASATAFALAMKSVAGEDMS